MNTKAKTADEWKKDRELLIGTLPEIFSPYKKNEDLDDAVEKWEAPIIEASMSYIIDDLFEDHAPARVSINSLHTKYKTLRNELDELENLAQLHIDLAASQYGINDVNDYFNRFGRLLADASKNALDKHRFLQENKLKTTEKRRLVESLVSVLLDAYVDITGRNIALSHRPATQNDPDEPSGPLIRFVAPIVRIFEPKKNINTIKTIIEDVKRKKAFFENRSAS